MIHPIHVPHHTLQTSIRVDPRHVVRVEGSTFVLRSGSRIRTAYSEADLRRLLEWYARAGR